MILLIMIFHNYLHTGDIGIDWSRYIIELFMVDLIGFLMFVSFIFIMHGTVVIKAINGWNRKLKDLEDWK